MGGILGRERMSQLVETVTRLADGKNTLPLGVALATLGERLSHPTAVPELGPSDHRSGYYSRMLLKHLYALSLEQPPTWGMVLGIDNSRSGNMLEGLRVDRLDAYIFGFRSALEALGEQDPEDGAFFAWLIRLKEFPGEAWVRKFLLDEGGDEVKAIQKIFGLLHRYLLEQRPRWFVDFNRSDRPSQIKNGLGEPLAADVRHPAHVAACSVLGATE